MSNEAHHMRPASSSGRQPSLTEESNSSTKHWLGIVGHCPHCGGPVYGPGLIETLVEAPFIRYSCECPRPKSCNNKPEPTAMPDQASAITIGERVPSIQVHITDRNRLAARTELLVEAVRSIHPEHASHVDNCVCWYCRVEKELRCDHNV